MLQLEFCGPLAWQALAGFLAGRGSARTERLVAEQYIRTVRIGEHTGWITAQPSSATVLRVEVSDSLLPVLAALQI